MSRELIDSLLRELADAAGLDHLALDDERACLLHLDGVTVHLEHWPAQDQLCLFSPLGDVDEAAEQDIRSRLLDANVLFCATGGATLGMPAGTRLVTLQQLVVVQGLDSARLQGLLEQFTEIAEAWTVNLQGQAPAETDTRATAPTDKAETTVIRA